MNEKNNVKRKGYSGIWIFWSVLFGMISLVSVTSLLIMYIYFTNGKGYQPPAAPAAKEEVPPEDAEDILAKEEASGIPKATNIPRSTRLKSSSFPGYCPFFLSSRKCCPSYRSQVAQTDSTPSMTVVNFSVES